MTEIQDVQQKIAALDARLRADREGLHPYYTDQMNWLLDISAQLVKHWEYAVQNSSDLQHPVEPLQLQALGDEIETIDGGLDGLTDSTAVETIRRLTNAIQASAESYLSHYADVMQSVQPQVAHSMRTVSGQVRTIRDGLAIISETLNLKSEIEKLSKETAAEAEDVRASLGLRADLELADFYKGYASSESDLSWWFRGGTGIVSVLALILAWVFYEQPPPSDDVAAYWGSTGLRIAALATIGGVAVYLSKLASSHRRNADWAQTMSVQLQTFSAFLKPVDESNARNRIYEEFARRVLGAPPTPTGDDAAVLPLSEVVSLINRSRT